MINLGLMKNEMSMIQYIIMHNILLQYTHHTWWTENRPNRSATRGYLPTHLRYTCTKYLRTISSVGKDKKYKTIY